MARAKQFGGMAEVFAEEACHAWYCLRTAEHYTLWNSKFCCSKGDQGVELEGP